jgi:adenylosuccinate lyase
MARRRTRPSRAASTPARFDHPLATRYASPDMVRIWSSQHRYTTWRRIWVALADAQRRVGLPITARQVSALRDAVDRIDFAAVAAHEKRTRHDVMAHLHAFGDVVPRAAGILHLGATSMDVVDNADLLLMREALGLLVARVADACRTLASFCERHADLPALGFTHLQPAQLTTVGKRASLWLSDLVDDLLRLEALRAGLRCRGLRGATGTQASFLRLTGQPGAVERLETLFARALGFTACYPVTGQTYSRKVDLEIASALVSFAASVHKLANDVRLLIMLREMDEPFEATQVGSSAMPYKRNPALSERATGLARYLISLGTSPPMTLAAQMFERTLDDSSNKRLVMPEMFMAADALAILLRHVFSGLTIYPVVIAARVNAELPFLVTEDLMMRGALAGGDRQKLHERIRRHAQEAGLRSKQLGLPSDVLERLRRDPALAKLDIPRTLDARRYVGLAPRQTRAFLRRVVRPVLRGVRAAPAPPAAIEL